MRAIIKGQPDIAEKIAVENLSYPFSYVDRLVTENGFSVCADIGHLVVMGVDPLEHLGKYLSRTRVIHLHGVDGGKDHVSLKYLDEALVRRLTGFLRDNDYRGVVTLEVFSEMDLEESIGVLRKAF